MISPQNQPPELPETSVSPKYFFPAPVWGAVILILTELLILATAEPVFYRDSSVYYNLIEAFRHGAWDRAFPPHLPVFFTALSGAITWLGVPTATALLLVSGVCTALTVFPIYGLLARFLPQNQAAWGVWLYALSPQIIRTGCAPLLDSGRFLFMMLGLWLIFAETPRFRFWKPLVLGSVYGALALVRVEGIILVSLLALTHFLMLVRRAKPTAATLSQACGRVLLPLLIMVIFISPRLIQMQNLTGCPAIEGRQVNTIRSTVKILTGKAPADGLQNQANATSIKYCGGNIEFGNIGKIKDQQHFWSNCIAGFNFIYLPFTVLGIGLLIKKRQWRAEFTLLLLLIFFYNLAHFILRADASRYFLINACFTLPFTVTGVAAVINYLASPGGLSARLIPLTLAIIAIIMIVRSLGNLNDRKSHCFRQAAQFFDADTSRVSTSRSGLSRPVVLVIGQDRGFGFYANVNVVNYNDYPFGLVSNMTVNEIIQNGLANKYVGFWTEKQLPDLIKIDAIAVFKSDWKPSADINQLRMCPVSADSRYRIYQVLPPPVSPSCQ